jgi:uncharacterized membrane protein YoaK (UPF0700 family)
MRAVLTNTGTFTYPYRSVTAWLMLSLAAGIVNGFAFLACHNFASHLTGLVTQMGLDWNNLLLILQSMIVVLAFFVGAVIAIVLSHRLNAFPRATWSVPMIAVVISLAGSSFIGILGAFGDSNHLTIGSVQPVLLLSILSFSMGIQNATVSAATRLAIRTTHLTGPITDLGIFFGMSLVTEGEPRKNAVRAALLRGGQIFAFLFGVVVSFLLASTLAYTTLLIAAGFVFISTYLVSSAEQSCSQRIKTH